MQDDLAAIIGFCVDCGGTLDARETDFKCEGCARIFSQSPEGVWDFRETEPTHVLPALFDTPEFLAWRKIFEKKELANWYVYSNCVFRYFSMAAQRIAGTELARSKKRDGWLIDLGAGSGAQLEHFAAKNYIGVDIALEGLAELKRRHPGATAICASVTALPFRTHAVERVLCMHTLEHLYHLAETLEEIVRIMKPGAIFHYGIPTEGGWAFWLGRQLLTGRHVRRTYDMDVNYIMDREHINDAPRVLKFLRMHFDKVDKSFWPIPFLPLLSTNVLIYGICIAPKFDK